MIRILFFGPVVEHVDNRQTQIDFKPDLRLHDIVEQLKEKFPNAFEIVSFIAVNNVQTRDMNLEIKDNDEIAFMAKFSGG